MKKKLKIIKNKIGIISFIFIIFFIHLPCQTSSSKYTQISLEKGLSQSSINCILQDSKGFMWFGTLDGLNRFDGFSFTVYKYEILNPNSLSHNTILSILEDKSGLLWIGTDGGGLNSYDSKVKQFKHYKHDTNNPKSISDNIVNTLFENKSGELWIGTNNGLNKFDPQTEQFVRYQHDPQDDNSLCHNIVKCVMEDQSGTLWIGTKGGGISRLSWDQQGKAKFMHLQHDSKNPNSIKNNNVYTILADNSERIWIGTFGGGISRLKQDKSGKTEFTHFHNNPQDSTSLIDDEVNLIFQDNKGIIWIGTDDGVDKFDPEQEQFSHFFSRGAVSIKMDRSDVLWVGTQTYGICKFHGAKEKFFHYKHDPANPNSLSYNLIWSFCEDSQGLLWIGTQEGLNQFDRQQNRFICYRNEPNNPNSLSDSAVRAIYEDQYQVLWIGTSEGGLNIFDKNRKNFTRHLYDPENPDSLSHNFVSTIFEDKAGRLWIGTYGGGLNKFDRNTQSFTRYLHDPDNENSLIHNFVNSIYEDSLGQLWIGTHAGLDRFNRDKNQFTHFKNIPDNQNSLSYNFVFSVLENPSGTLWIGTFGGGLNKFVQKEQKFTHFTEKEGLANNAIYGILYDEKGNLWISTNSGISKFNPLTEKFKNYDISDGLQGKEFDRGAYYKSKKTGEMFFGGLNGFNTFFPDQIKDSPFIPPVVITDFKIFNKSVAIGGDSPLQTDISDTQEIVLSYKDQIFSFEFVVLDFQIPEKNQLAYMMDGFENDWNYVGTKRFATYTNLDPGHYTLRVKGSNNDGVWNEEGVSLKITITPPFWRTWWFQMIGLIAILSLIYGFITFRTRKIEAQKEHLENVVAERTLDLELARAAADSANEAKSMFLARMSHEIRTPMNGVIGFADMLLDSQLTEEQVEFARNITKSGESLLSLINEILDFSKIEAGEMALQYLDFDIEVTVFDVCHLIIPRLENRQVEVLCRVGDDVPSYINSDAGRIRQVLLNLMVNAAKFTEKGEIELTLNVEEERDDQVKLHFSVRDTGIGIPEDKTETVFEVFQQADGSTTRKYGGTGLGLAICKQIVRLLKGNIWVESQLNQGSTFHFTAWVGKSKEKIVKRITSEDLKGKHALIVDDNLSNLEILSHMLKQMGITSIQLHRGDQVMPAVEEALNSGKPFDILILDIQMPNISGYEVSRMIREHHDKQISNVPILAFSSSTAKQTRRYKESGFDGFLPKPIHRDKMYTMIKRLLGSEMEKEDQIKRKEVLTQHTLVEEAKHSIRILLAEDNPLNQKLASFMLKKAGYQMEIANNGKEVTEIYLANPEKFDLIFMDIHMPEMDGLEATQVLREKGFKNIPIIAMTADAMKGDREKCLDAGMNDYIPKPIKREAIFNVLKQWVLERDTKD